MCKTNPVLPRKLTHQYLDEITRRNTVQVGKLLKTQKLQRTRNRKLPKNYSKQKTSNSTAFLDSHLSLLVTPWTKLQDFMMAWGGLYFMFAHTKNYTECYFPVLKTTIEGFGGKRALGFLLKSELCQKRSKFGMQSCLCMLNNVLHVFCLKFASFLRYYV